MFRPKYSVSAERGYFGKKQLFGSNIRFFRLASFWFKICFGCPLRERLTWGKSAHYTPESFNDLKSFPPPPSQTFPPTSPSSSFLPSFVKPTRNTDIPTKISPYSTSSSPENKSLIALWFFSASRQSKGPRSYLKPRARRLSWRVKKNVWCSVQSTSKRLAYFWNFTVYRPAAFPAEIVKLDSESDIMPNAWTQAGSNLGDLSGAEVAIQAGQSSSPCKIDWARLGQNHMLSLLLTDHLDCCLNPGQAFLRDFVGVYNATSCDRDTVMKVLCTFLRG